MTINKEAGDSANVKISIFKQTRILSEIDEEELFDLAVKSFNDSKTSTLRKFLTK